MQFEQITALVVDDNPQMRTVVSEILKAVGIRRPREAGDGESAFAVLQSEPIDVVFTDLLMKPTGGIEFARRLRTSKDSPDVYVPLIVISGRTTEGAVEEARNAGVNEIIVKPISARAVLDRLRMVIEHPRPFVRTRDFFGPDRRRRADPDYIGPLRREADKSKVDI